MRPEGLRIPNRGWHPLEFVEVFPDEIGVFKRCCAPSCSCTGERHEFEGQPARSANSFTRGWAPGPGDLAKSNTKSSGMQNGRMARRARDAFDAELLMELGLKGLRGDCSLSQETGQTHHTGAAPEPTHRLHSSSFFVLCIEDPIR